jgi:hypothetical protein
MYTGLLHTHSLLRYVLLALLLIAIIKALVSWLGKKPFINIDNKISLWLLIVAHVQLLIGLSLYFISPFVQFTADTMKTKELRYWAVEHSVAMIIAIVFITVGRISMKKIVTDEGKHKRLFIMNVIALIIIVATILNGGRGLL